MVWLLDGKWGVLMSVVFDLSCRKVFGSGSVVLRSVMG